MEKPISSLCSPLPQMTCFGCCPPIRPAHYDPLDYVGSLRREFVENRRRFLQEGARYRPIVGYHCWALGFLDAQGRQVGCLLHPRQNGGRDLRGLIDYGTKCERESCFAARMFDSLPLEGKRFWLPLARGLNAFYYSSPRANPLFHLLLWGPHVLEALRLSAEKMGWTVTEVLHRYPFLLDRSRQPRAHRYLLRLLLERAVSGPPEGPSIDHQCHELWQRTLLLPEIGSSEGACPGEDHVHQLPLENDYADFLRFGLGWQRSTSDKATRLQNLIEIKVHEVAHAGLMKIRSSS